MKALLINQYFEEESFWMNNKISEKHYDRYIKNNLSKLLRKAHINFNTGILSFMFGSMYRRFKGSMEIIKDSSTYFRNHVPHNNGSEFYRFIKPPGGQAIIWFLRTNLPGCRKYGKESESNIDTTWRLQRRLGLCISCLFPPLYSKVPPRRKTVCDFNHLNVCALIALAWKC